MKKEIKEIIKMYEDKIILYRQTINQLCRTIDEIKKENKIKY